MLMIAASHKINGLIFLVMKNGDTMRTKNALNLPIYATTTPTNNVHNMCGTFVFNLKPLSPFQVKFYCFL